MHILARMITQSIAIALLLQFAAVEGQVRDAVTNAAIPLARVELLNGQIPIEQQFTDGEGRFRFAHLNTGRYTISVTSPWYESALLELGLPFGSLPVTVELLHRKAKPEGPPRVMSLGDYLVPERARNEFARARSDMKRQDCSKAVRHFENGLKSYDKDASAHNDLGNCYRKLGRFERAEESFKRARVLSDSVYVALNLAELYSVQMRFDEAAEVMREAVRRQPDSGDGYYGLAIVYIRQGNVRDAEINAREAESRRHRIADVHLLLAQLYSAQDKLPEAIRQLEDYLKEAPEGPLSEKVLKDLETATAEPGRCSAKMKSRPRCRGNPEIEVVKSRRCLSFNLKFRD